MREEYGNVIVFRGINISNSAATWSLQSGIGFAFNRPKFLYMTTAKGYSEEELIKEYNKKDDDINPIEPRLMYICIDDLEEFDILKGVINIAESGIKDIAIEGIEELVRPYMLSQLSSSLYNNISYDGVERLVHIKVCSVMNELYFLAQELGLTLSIVLNNDVYSIDDFLYTDIVFVREKGNASHFAGDRYMFSTDGNMKFEESKHDRK